jgi:hypothetical protein
MSTTPKHPYSADDLVKLINATMGRDVAKERPDIASQNDAVATVSIEDVTFIDLSFKQVQTSILPGHVAPVYEAYTIVHYPGSRDEPPSEDVKELGGQTRYFRDAVKNALHGYIENQMNRAIEGLFIPPY